MTHRTAINQAVTNASNIPQVARFLDDCEFQDYINEAGCWAKQKDNTDATPPPAGAPGNLVEVGRVQRVTI